MANRFNIPKRDFGYSNNVKASLLVWPGPGFGTGQDAFKGEHFPYRAGIQYFSAPTIRINLRKKRLLKFFCRAIILLIAWTTALQGRAQSFGGNPSYLKWSRLSTDTVQVIFPRGYDSLARRVAGLVHQTARKSLHTIGSRIRPFPLVLQPLSTLPGGQVMLGPFRAELQLTPFTDSYITGSLPWPELLTWHEYRHVQQYQQFRRGLSRAAYYLFGEQGQGVANSMAVPDWFFEGDAVAQETLLSKQGRGRLPYFLHPYRAIWSAEKRYSWMKLRNGSFRDLVPDHYRLGYMLSIRGRQEFGDTIWRSITADAAAFRGLFYPFQRAFRRHTGVSFRRFREETLASFSHMDRRDQVNPFAPSAHTTVQAKESGRDTAAAAGRQVRRFQGDELFPQWLHDSAIVFLGSSYSRIPRFQIRDLSRGTTRTLAKRRVASEEYFALRGDRIVYSAYRPDPRWTHRDFQEIVLLDLHSGKQRRLTRGTRYFSPDISAGGDTVLVVHADPSGRQELHLLSGKNGSLIHRVPLPPGWIPTQPKCFGADSAAIALRNARGEMAMATVHLGNGGYRLLTPFSYGLTGWTQVSGDTILFNFSREGRDELWAHFGGDNYIFLPPWENRSTDNYQLSMRGNQQAWAMYTAAGWRALTGSGRFERVDEKADQRGETVRPEPAPAAQSIEAPISPYPKAAGGWHVHSWRPLVTDPEYAFSILGENTLRTVQTEYYLLYNRNERYKQAGIFLRYGGWYPLVQGGASYSFDRAFRDSSSTLRWNEWNASLGASAPLRFVCGNFLQRLTPGLGLQLKSIRYSGAWRETHEDLAFPSADISLHFSNQQISARPQIFPAWAQTLLLRHRFVADGLEARQTLASGSLYFPGLRPTHGLVVQLAWQSRDTLQQYLFSNQFPEARGYGEIYGPRMWKTGLSYHLPLCYPDVGFGNLVYLLRIRAAAFYDYMVVQSIRTGHQTGLHSSGIELYVDTKWWNQQPATFGIRYSRLLDRDPFNRSPNQWSFILPLTLLGTGNSNAAVFP